MKKYSHLNRYQRYQLAALLQANHSLRAAACTLQVAPSTISRELSRNSKVNDQYSPSYADDFANLRQAERKYPRRCKPDMIAFIEQQLCHEQWSPEQIVGYCRVHKIPMVSHETIYQLIYQNRNCGGDLWLHLRAKHRKRRKRLHHKHRRGIIPNRISIDERPIIVNQKLRYGDWEIDTIIGKGHKSVALSLVERKSQYALLLKADNAKADTIRKLTINALAPFKELVHTITSDNGTEFTQHQAMAKKLQCGYFFAHPYSSWERGLNEYTNKLFRQYLPKKSDFNCYENGYFLAITHKLNTRPRKTLGFKSPLQVFINNFTPT